MIMFGSRQEVVIYLAGFLDGEGSFGIYENRRSGFLPKVSAYQVNLRPIELLQETFGGSIAKDKKFYPSSYRKAIGYSWQISGPALYKALLELRPYLVVKAEQADCLIELFKLIEVWEPRKNLSNVERRLSDEEYLERSILCVRCKNLNQNHGPAATTEREGLGENQVSDSLDCTDGKGAEVAEMTTRLS